MSKVWLYVFNCIKSVESNMGFRVQVSKVWLYIFNCIKSVESNVSFRVQGMVVYVLLHLVDVKVWWCI